MAGDLLPKLGQFTTRLNLLTASTTTRPEIETDTEPIYTSMSPLMPLRAISSPRISRFHVLPGPLQALTSVTNSVSDHQAVACQSAIKADETTKDEPGAQQPDSTTGPARVNIDQVD